MTIGKDTDDMMKSRLTETAVTEFLLIAFAKYFRPLYTNMVFSYSDLCPPGKAGEAIFASRTPSRERLNCVNEPQIVTRSRWVGHGDLLGKFLPQCRMHDAERRSWRRLATEQKRAPPRQGR